MFASKTTMTDLFKSATKTIDGITMYIVCAIGFNLSIVLGVADLLDIHLPFHGAAVGFGWLVTVPVFFTFYITLNQMQILTGKWAEIVNALILVYLCVSLLIAVLKM